MPTRSDARPTEAQLGGPNGGGRGVAAGPSPFVFGRPPSSAISGARVENRHSAPQSRRSIVRGQ